MSCDRKQIVGCLEMTEQEKKGGGQLELMMSWVHAYINAYQTVHFKCVKFIVHQLSLIKASKKILHLKV